MHTSILKWQKSQDEKEKEKKKKRGGGGGGGEEAKYRKCVHRY